jgi:hypothetical protein
MRNVLLLIIVTISGFMSAAQTITKADLKAIDMSQFDTNGDGKVKDDEAAIAIMQLYELDQNNSISRSQIVDGLNKTKEQIYVDVNEWFVHVFKSGKNVIQLSDKDAGCIIAKGHVVNLGSTVSFASNADISVWVYVRVDIKDNRMRITTTIESYEMEKGIGILGALSGDNQTTHMELTPSQCFPYTKKYRREGAKAFVQAHLYSMVLIDKLTAAVQNANDDW